MIAGYSTEQDTDYGSFKTMQAELKLLRKALFRQTDFINLIQEGMERSVTKTDRRKAHILMNNALQDYTNFCEQEGLDYYV